MKSATILRFLQLVVMAALMTACLGDVAEFSPSAAAECTTNEECERDGAQLVCRDGACVPVDIMPPGCGQGDDDGDDVCNGDDNCPNTPNPDQADSDEDGTGDACDDDGDLCHSDLACSECQEIGCYWTGGQCALDCIEGRDCFEPDGADGGCPADPPCDDEAGEDGCDDSDDDADGWPNNNDNCPTITNPSQADSDNNGVGDACDDTIGESCSADSDCDTGVCVVLSDLFPECDSLGFCTFACQDSNACSADGMEAACITAPTTGEQLCIYATWADAAGCLP